MGQFAIVRFQMAVRWTFYESFEDDCEAGTGRRKWPDAYTPSTVLDPFKGKYR